MFNFRSEQLDLRIAAAQIEISLMMSENDENQDDCSVLKTGRLGSPALNVTDEDADRNENVLLNYIEK